MVYYIQENKNYNYYRLLVKTMASIRQWNTVFLMWQNNFFFLIASADFCVWWKYPSIIKSKWNKILLHGTGSKNKELVIPERYCLAAK